MNFLSLRIFYPEFLDSPTRMGYDDNNMFEKVACFMIVSSQANRVFGWFSLSFYFSSGYFCCEKLNS